MKFAHSVQRIACLSAAIAMLASAPVLAGEREGRHERQQRTEQTAPNGFDHGMQPVAHNAGPGERAHGWRYFSDPATYRAVVISPDGDYYLSRGKGLRWVAGAQTQD